MNAPSRKRRVVLLGSTGSIGCSTLKVARELPGEIEIIALAASANIEKLAAQARETGVRHVAWKITSRDAKGRAQFALAPLALGPRLESATGNDLYIVRAGLKT